LTCTAFTGVSSVAMVRQECRVRVGIYELSSGTGDLDVLGGCGGADKTAAVHGACPPVTGRSGDGGSGELVRVDGGSIQSGVERMECDPSTFSMEKGGFKSMRTRAHVHRWETTTTGRGLPHCWLGQCHTTWVDLLTFHFTWAPSSAAEAVVMHK
jgi:hypothetical protein